MHANRRIVTEAPSLGHRAARIAIGAFVGATLLATVTGFAYLFSQLSTHDGPFHGLRNFTIGATAGAIVGGILGGFLGDLLVRRSKR